jgi:hypothetical protein
MLWFWVERLLAIIGFISILVVALVLGFSLWIGPEALRTQPGPKRRSYRPLAAPFDPSMSGTAASPPSSGPGSIEAAPSMNEKPG